MAKIKLFAATKAFVNYRNKILLLRESSKYKDGANAGSYDVPGGRIEPGKRFDNSLLREIEEETGLNATIGNPFFTDEWQPVVRGEQWQIIGTYFECFSSARKVKLSKDHDKYLWINPKDYKKHHPYNSGVNEAFKKYL